MEDKKIDISYSNWSLIKKVVIFVKPYKNMFVLAGVLTILAAAVAWVRPILVGDAVGDVLKEGVSVNLGYFAAVYLGILILEAALQFLVSYTSNLVGQNVTVDMRQKVFEKITKFQLAYFDKNPIGALVTRVISDVDGVANIFAQGLLVIIGDVLKLIIVVATMFYLDFKLSLLILLPIPILIFATRIFKNAIKKAFGMVRKEVSRMNTFVQEHVSGMSIVQVFNQQKRESEKFNELNKAHMVANIKSIWAYAIFFPVVEILSSLSIAFMLWYGIYSVDQQSNGADEIALIMKMIMYVHMLYRPIRQLADRFNTLQMGIVNAQRIFKVLETEEEIQDTGHLEMTRFKGAITFDQVQFSYLPNTPILKDIQLDIAPGEKIAFVGATGAGKSTMINLISRLYEIDKGKILIDGVDIKEIKLSNLREQIAVVLQDVFLFSNSIYQNICLGNEDISKAEVEKAAKLVGAHDFIERLPGGYDFNVRERGGVLSAGQRQLISFLRAYVFNPSIIVLDEATSSIDSESEKLIEKALDILTEDRTSIIIAHRLSTIQKADRIVLLDQGEIKEVGSHQELMERKSLYYDLYQAQLLEKINS